MPSSPDSSDHSSDHWSTSTAGGATAYYDELTTIQHRPRTNPKTRRIKSEPSVTPTKRRREGKLS